MGAHEFRAPRTDDERAQMRRALKLSFPGFTDELVEAFEARAGDENMRVVVEGAEVASALAYYRFGHFFGGRSVPALGIAVVGVPPEKRGGGGASRMMDGAVLEAAREGFPISTLYASTAALYRRSGYEIAGTCHRYDVPTRALRDVPRPAGVRSRRGTEGDRPAVKALYRRAAAAHDGYIDRDDARWSVHLDHPTRPSELVVFEEGGAIVGYALYATQGEGESPDARVLLIDGAFETTDAGRAILRFLAGFAALHPNAGILGPAVHPLLMLTGERFMAVTRVYHWMLRVVDVERALAERGYPPGVTARVDLLVEDPLVEANSGRHTLRVEGGRGAVTRDDPSWDADRAIRLGPRGLAPLYTGALTPRAARAAGLIEAGDGAVEGAAGVFTTGAPTMGEMF